MSETTSTIDDALKLAVETAIASALGPVEARLHERLDDVRADMRQELREVREANVAQGEKIGRHDLQIAGLERLNMDAIRTAVRDELTREKVEATRQREREAEQRAGERRRQLKQITVVVGAVALVAQTLVPLVERLGGLFT